MVVSGEMIGLQREIIIMKSRDSNIYGTNVCNHARTVLCYTWQVWYYINYAIGSIFIQQNVNALHAFSSLKLHLHILSFPWLINCAFWLQNYKADLLIFKDQGRSLFRRFSGKYRCRPVLCKCAVNSVHNFALNLFTFTGKMLMMQTLISWTL